MGKFLRATTRATKTTSGKLYIYYRLRVMLPLGTKGNTHPQKFMQTYAECLHDHEKMKLI